MSSQQCDSARPRLLIWGAAGHALVVADIVRLAGEYEIVGFLDDLHPDRDGTDHAGARVYGGAGHLARLRDDGVKHAIIAIGDCQARLRCAEAARRGGFTLATAAHPRAVIAADASIGTGTVIAAGAIVNPGCTIGENVIINTGATVDHDCTVEDGAHISPGVNLAGKVRVGRASWVGIGSAVTEGIRIGSGTMIGAGSVVVEDVPDDVVAYGVPARVTRQRGVSDQ